MSNVEGSYPDNDPRNINISIFRTVETQKKEQSSAKAKENASEDSKKNDDKREGKM